MERNETRDLNRPADNPAALSNRVAAEWPAAVVLAFRENQCYIAIEDKLVYESQQETLGSLQSRPKSVVLYSTVETELYVDVEVTYPVWKTLMWARTVTLDQD